MNGTLFTDELGYTIFADGHPELNEQHRLHIKLQHKPRCKLCLIRFAGIGGWIMRERGNGVSSRNPDFCNACDGFIEAYPGGAEVEMSTLFIDICNSTQYAVGAQPADPSRRVSAFLNAATEMITDKDVLLWLSMATVSSRYGRRDSAAWTMPKRL